MRSGPMTVPFVAAFSASCSAKGTSAPRPATRAGARPARVTVGADDCFPSAPWAAGAPVSAPSPTTAAVSAATVM